MVIFVRIVIPHALPLTCYPSRVTGHVAMTGKLLNIKDAYSHPLFYSGVDEATGFVTRNILCFPIKDDTGTWSCMTS